MDAGSIASGVPGNGYGDPVALYAMQTDCALCVEEQMMPCVEDCYKQSENTVCLKMKTIATGKKLYPKC